MGHRFTVRVLGAFLAKVLIYSVTPGPQMSPLGFTLASLKMQEAAHPFSPPVAPVVHPAVPTEGKTGVCRKGFKKNPSAWGQAHSE